MAKAAFTGHFSTCFFAINGAIYTGQFEESEEKQWANSDGSEPDVDWSFVDSKGHFHAFDTYTSELPTLIKRSSSVPCDGSCGVDDCRSRLVLNFYCLICDEQVEPKFNHVVKPVLVSSTCSWSATVRGPFIAPGEKVTTLIEKPGRATRFGVAVVYKVTYQDGVTEIVLEGIGRLGFRPSPGNEGSDG